MDLTLHPNAASNFDEKARALVHDIAAGAPRDTPQGFHWDSYVVGHLAEADIIGEPKYGLVDYRGQQVAKFFQDEGQLVGLEGEAFERVLQLAEAMQRTHELRDRVSKKALVEAIFEWLEKTYKGEQTGAMCPYVLGAVGSAIKIQEIWMPIARLHIEQEFTVGQLTFKPITASLFQKWEEQLTREPRGDVANQLSWLNRERRKLQGLAAATLVVEAEPDRAVELAFTRADDAVAVLRLFDGTNLDPDLVSCCALQGREGIQSHHYLIVEGMKLVGSGSGIAPQGTRDWALDSVSLELFQRNGLTALSRLLAADARTAFQEDILDGLRIYSRSGLARDPSDKLIYILVFLESLFVKNDSEPLQDNIVHRIAFLLRSEREERRRIINQIKAAYALRSAFLHHGRRLEDMQALRAFMRIAFDVMFALINNIDRFKSISEFHAAIDNERLS